MKARFHLPDFATHATFNLLFIDILRERPEYFRKDIEIASVYGTFPPAIWNGGRFQPGSIDVMNMKKVIHAFNKQGIPLRFTFSNPLIEERHLGDRLCNTILRLAHNEMNGVIVVSPILEKYIREKYPKYKITSSTSKCLNQYEQLENELGQGYDIVVLDYNMNNRYDLLEKIPQEDRGKCEILVNPNCKPNCPRRLSHYRSIGAEQLAYMEHVKRYGITAFGFEDILEEKSEYEKYIDIEAAHCSRKHSYFDVCKLSTFVKPDDLWDKYIPMGFNQFKFEGRTYSFENILEYYVQYMANPECRDETRLMLLKEFADQGLIKTPF